MRKFDFNDILINPVDLSDIDSRSDISVNYESGELPIFAAPMDTVIDDDNIELFTELGINVCLPRGLTKKYKSGDNNPYVFESYGLSEIDNLLDGSLDSDSVSDYILIDVANGHMRRLYKMVSDFKEKFPSKILMVGNIANPNTYKLLSLAGADFIRVGIGNGAGCLTTQQTGVGYPMASLIKECYDLKLDMSRSAKIVADGGFQKFSDMNKALSLGSDYVMLGSVLNKTIESSGDNYLKIGLKVSKSIAKLLHKRKIKIYKKFRGMSTKEVQKKWGRKVLRTSEGVVRIRPVEYTLNGWVENYTDYLETAMSYSGCVNLGEFIGKAEYVFITNHSYERFSK